ncbi:MAG: PepSY-associated helix protein [Proteobacteria bacterium]|nr:PepSY-associated helix protein [Pseudomonadota bacterium]
MRAALVVMHRWFGLAAAAFLFVSGATGALISWDHELDEWLNPRLFKADSAGPVRDSLSLARQFEASHPDLQVTWLPLGVAPGEALNIRVEPRPDKAGGKARNPGFNQVALDPVTGAVQARREWGVVSLSRENLLPFLYKLHYSMHLPDVDGIETGVWLMGIIAMVWSLDCFVALWISFPKLASWRKSFAFRWRQGGYKLNFDLHRSGGVWLWLLVLIIAVTSVSMNLQLQFVRPLVNRISPLSPSPWDGRSFRAHDDPAAPLVTREAVLASAREEAARRGWTLPAGGIFYSPEADVYGVGFYQPGHDHGDGGLGNAWLHYEGSDGRFAGASVPGEGSAGDIFMQAQFPLHSGRIAGLPGRILVSLLGLAIASFSVTGVVIWARKRKARVMAKENRREPVALPQA